MARARPQLVEFLSRCPDWLLTTSQHFVPEAALSSLGGITDHKGKISVLLDLLEEAGPAAWRHFAQSVCMEYDLPLDLEVLLMSSAGEGKRGQASFLWPNTANALATHRHHPVEAARPPVPSLAWPCFSWKHNFWLRNVI